MIKNYIIVIENHSCDYAKINVANKYEEHSPEGLKMTVPKDMNDVVLNPQQQASPMKKLLSKSAQITGGGPFDMLLAASMAQVEGQAGLLHSRLDQSPQGSLPSTVDKSDDSRFKNILATVLKHEGRTYVQKDGSESSRFGILQSTAGAFGYKGNVKNMSRAQAEAIYKKIWAKSGSASLPYPLSLVHFDTYVNSPAAAMKLLNKSGGNAETYLAMRARRYSRLAELRPERYGRYLKGWMKRIADLRNITAEHTVISRFAQNDILPADGTKNSIIKA